MKKECCQSEMPATARPGPVRHAFTIGIVGNPNCGKTTLFNALTGARQRVGNWPGVTVERKEGQYRNDGETVRVVDLPGVYTLGTVPGLDEQSLDERLARDHILADEIDVIVNIVDAGNLERNLYLTTQLLEMRRPMVVALNMMDGAKKAGLDIDPAALARHLGCPVIAIVAVRKEGIEALKKTIEEVANSRRSPDPAIDYPGPVQPCIEEATLRLRGKAASIGVDPRWLAVRLIEGDDLAERIVGADPVRRAVEAARREMAAEKGEDLDILIADGRYSFAHAAFEAAVRKRTSIDRTTSDGIDRLVLNGFAGPLIFLAVIYLMFTLTINVGGAFVDFFDIAAATLFVDGIKAAIAAIGLPEWLGVLLGDGVGGGIQVVTTFIPIIGLLFLFLSVLESSGYMARAAFLMDRLMRMVGLPGKAFVPLIVGFGCNVPAIMASRTLDQERDRIMAVLMTPFMSCGARLTVYALFAAAFFPSGGQNVVFLLYLIGIGAAIATGFLLKFTVLKGETSPFVMELPPYRRPHLRDVAIHAWNRLKGFLFGAGRIIVVVVMCLSLLNSFGTDGSFGNENTEKSLLSALGRMIVPAFRPMGLSDENWPAAVGIFTGIFAKEAVVGTLDALYDRLGAKDGAKTAPATRAPFDLLAGFGEALATIPQNFRGLADLVTDPLGLSAVGGRGGGPAGARGVASNTFGAMVERFHGPVGAFAYLLFVLLYFPCAAALGAVAREIGGRWAVFAALWTTGLAYVTATLFYQTATFATDPLNAASWILAVAAALALFVFLLYRAGRTPAGSGLAPR